METPQTINTDERIFRITNFDGDTFLCNLSHLQLHDLKQIKKLSHMWNFEWEGFGKDDLKEMIIYRDKPSKEALKQELFNLTGEDSIETVKEAIEVIEEEYTSGRVASMKAGFADGRVVSDKYASWCETRAKAEDLIKQIEEL